MQVGNLIKNIRHPQTGIGIVIEVGSNEDYIIAVFPVYGFTIVYADEWEVVSEAA